MKQGLKTITIFLLLISIAGMLSWYSIWQMNRVFKPIRVGVSAGPQAEIMGIVKTLVAKDGVNLQIVIFNDYNKLNEALYLGDIQINSFQHQPYLNRVIADRNYDLIPIGKTILMPMGLYSKKIHTLTDLPVNSSVVIPKDLINGSRALLLLAKAGLISLKDPTSYNQSPKDIAANPKNLAIREVDAAEIAHLIDTSDIALINASYASTIGFVPTRDALTLEDSTSPYFNLLVARSDHKEDMFLEKIVTAYQSNDVKTFIQEHFHGTIITAW